MYAIYFTNDKHRLNFCFVHKRHRSFGLFHVLNAAEVRPSYVAAVDLGCQTSLGNSKAPAMRAQRANICPRSS